MLKNENMPDDLEDFIGGEEEYIKDPKDIEDINVGTASFAPFPNNKSDIVPGPKNFKGKINTALPSVSDKVPDLTKRTKNDFGVKDEVPAVPKNTETKKKEKSQREAFKSQAEADRFERSLNNIKKALQDTIIAPNEAIDALVLDLGYGYEKAVALVDKWGEDIYSPHATWAKKKEKSQMDMGLDVEKEHKPTVDWIKDEVEKTDNVPPSEDIYSSIAKDHLDEFPTYYTALDKMEKGLKAKESKEFFEAMSNDPSKFIQPILSSLKSKYGELEFYAAAPFPFSRSGQNFVGFWAFGEKYATRFEFLRNATGEGLKSVSVWDIGAGFDAAPKITIFVGRNASTDDIASAIVEEAPTDDLPVSEKVFHSRVLEESAKEDVQAFIDSQGTDFPTVAAAYRNFGQWAVKRNIRLIGDIAFRKYYKELAADGEESTPKTLGKGNVTVKKGMKDDPVSVPEYDDFEKEVLNNSVLYKYEMMAEIVKRIVTWDPLYRNVFIYGSGGIGKTHTVNEVVTNFADQSQIVKLPGAVSGFTGLLQVLWDNRTKKIIIFDDNDSMFEIPKAVNILKAAMENKDPRIITYIRYRRGGRSESALQVELGRLNENIVSIWKGDELLLEEYITDEERKFYEARLIDVEDEDELDDEELDMGDLDPDVDPAYGLGSETEVPDKFQFTSRIIFISNLTQAPQPLTDRCILIGLLLSKEQILSLIESKLENLMADTPQITMNLKKKVLVFMRTYVHRINKQLTFRLFQQLCAIFYSDHPKAKELAYLAMTSSEGMKQKLR